MSLFGDITNIILGVSGILSQLDALVLDSRTLSENVRSEVRKIKAFKFDPKWKNRVINVPKAIDQTRDLVAEISSSVSDGLHAFKSNVQAIRGAVAAIGELKPEKGGGGVLKVLQDITDIKNFVGEVDALIKSLASFVDVLRKVTDELSSAETLFLQQGNSRKVVSEKSTIRIGNLHS